MLYIVIASVLSTFDIKAQDETGQDIPVDRQFSPSTSVTFHFLSIAQSLTHSQLSSGLWFHTRDRLLTINLSFASHAMPFPCRLVPRSAFVAEVISKATE